MKRLHHLSSWAAVIALVSAGAAGAAQAGRAGLDYTLTDLGADIGPGYHDSEATSINQAGDVAGMAYLHVQDFHTPEEIERFNSTSQAAQATYIRPVAIRVVGGRLDILGPVNTNLGSYVGTRATSINEAGWVTGTEWLQRRQMYPLPRLWSPQGEQQALFNACCNADVRAMNAAGEVVGNFSYNGPEAPDPAWSMRAYKQAPDGTLTLLGQALPPEKVGQTASLARAINTLGSVAGGALLDGGQWHATLFRGGETVDLGPQATAVSLNDRDDVVLEPVTARHQPQFKRAGHAPRALGTLPGMQGSFARGMNDHGAVVGHATPGTDDTLGDGNTRAFLWRHGHLVDLNTLIPANSGWTLVDAVGINDRLQIAATGRRADGTQHALLLTPAQRR